MKNLKGIIFTAAGLLLALSSCHKPVKETRHEYYRHIAVDKMNHIQGRYPLDSGKWEITNCYRFAYDQKNRLCKLEYFVRGKPVLDPWFDASLVIIRYKYKGSSEAWHFYHKYLGTPLYIERKSYLLVTFGRDGYPLRKGYIGERSPGVSGVQWDWESDGRCVRYPIDKKGTVRANPLGVFSYEYIYDGAGNLVTITARDSSKAICEDSNGVAIAKYEYDSLGNLTSMSFFDTSDNPVESRDLGAAQVKRRYDSLGNMIQESFFDRDYHLHENNEGIVTIRYEYFDSGELKKVSYLGESGELKENKTSGIAVIEFVYDSTSRILTENCYGANGRLKNKTREGFASVHLSFDEKGNVLETSYYDLDGNLIESNESGYAVEKCSYDVNNWPVEISYFDSHLKLTELEDYGWAILRYERNNRERTLKVSFFGADGKPKDSKQGPAQLEIKYNEYMRPVYVKARDARGRRILRPPRATPQD